jgi:hypothetical protein
MANRNFKPGSKTMEQETIKLYAKFTVGAANAITLNSGLGITSIARSAAGKLSITLEDIYPTYLHSNLQLYGAAGAALASRQVQFVSEAVASTKIIILGISDCAASPAFADLASGDIGYLEITLKNSTV